MCTVSYLPLTTGGYILTSNRDEAPVRNAVEVRVLTQSGRTMIYPEDPEARGSWFAISDNGIAGCLLNGAFEPFEMGPQFTHSRGHVLLDTVRSGMFQTEHARLRVTAPFTLLLFTNLGINEFVWDGAVLHQKDLDPGKPGFWSSVTLYPEEVRKWRRTLFEKWLKDHEHYSQGDIIEFHKYGADGDTWNGFVMNRDNRVRTLSITSVHATTQELLFKYRNLLTDHDFEKSILVQPDHDMASD